MALTKEQIISVEDLGVVPFEVPEWGGSVNMRTLSAHETMQFTDSLATSKKSSANVKLVALCVCDESGNRLFTDSDVEALRKKSTAAIVRIARQAMQMNGLLKKWEDAEDDVKKD